MATSPAGTIPSRADSARLWLPVDRVFSVKGAGAVITGTLTRGTLAVGDRIYVASGPGMVETQCRALEVHGQRVERAVAPTTRHRKFGLRPAHSRC